VVYVFKNFDQGSTAALIFSLRADQGIKH